MVDESATPNAILALKGTPVRDRLASIVADANA